VQVGDLVIPWASYPPAFPSFSDITRSDIGIVTQLTRIDGDAIAWVFWNDGKHEWSPRKDIAVISDREEDWFKRKP